MDRGDEAQCSQAEHEKGQRATERMDSYFYEEKRWIGQIVPAFLQYSLVCDKGKRGPLYHCPNDWYNVVKCLIFYNNSAAEDRRSVLGPLLQTKQM